MKDVDRATLNVKRVVCSFCSYGCELGIIFDDLGIKGVEYLKDCINGSRLCPRGSAAAHYLDHPNRLTSPVKDRHYVDWNEVRNEIKNILGHPEEVAVTFDRNLTLEEHGAILDFCRKTGIDNCASSYLEPEVLLTQFIDKQFSLYDVERAQVIVIIGDIFSFVPMISKYIIAWKLKDRKNRLIVIDSVGSYTAKFATDFLKVEVGFEPLLLLALAGEEVANAGIPAQVIKDIGRNLKETSNGLIFVVLPFGHTQDPILFNHALSRLQRYSGKQVVPFCEFSDLRGNSSFGDIIDLAQQQKIKYLMNFGEFFPYYYPQIAKQLRGVEIIATATLKFKGGMVLPTLLNLEKSGTILTTFGERKIDGGVGTTSGAKDIIDILSLYTEVDNKKREYVPLKLKVDVHERINKIIEDSKKRGKKAFTLIGEKNAFNFLGFWEQEKIKVNSSDANELGLRPDDVVIVESESAKGEFNIEMNAAMPRGLLSISAETPVSKGLFDFRLDQGMVIFMPTEVKIWRKG